METIVVDHHNPPAELPPAFAVIDPKLPGYPFRDLAGCAVAAKVEWALRFSQGPFFGTPVCLLAARPANGADRGGRRAPGEPRRDRSGHGAGGAGHGRRSSARGSRPSRSAPRCSCSTPPARRACSPRRSPAATFGIEDIGPLVRQYLPALAGRSLIAIQAESREARYRDRPPAEIDTLADLFRSLVLERERERLAPALRRMDLVTLGTLADLMPLVDENRILVRQGLEVLRRGERTGLRQLLMKKDLLGKRISATDVAWQVAPVLNSAGRMGEPGKATRLFLAEALVEIEGLVAELFELDSRRRTLGESAWQAALGAGAGRASRRAGGRCVLVHDERIPRGITGIMASRLQGFFKAPSVVIAETADRAVGSIRAVRGGVHRGVLRPVLAPLHRERRPRLRGRVQHGRATRCPGFLADYAARIGEMEPPGKGEEVLADRRRGARGVPDARPREGRGSLRALRRGQPAPAVPDPGPARRPVRADRPQGSQPPQAAVRRGEEPLARRCTGTRRAGSPAEFAMGDTVNVVYRLERNTWGSSENLRMNVVDLQK